MSELVLERKRDIELLLAKFLSTRLSPGATRDLFGEMLSSVMLSVDSAWDPSRGPLSTFVYRCAANRLKNLGKRWNRKESREVFLEATVAELEAAGPEYGYSFVELEADMLRALADLPEKERQLFGLLLEGYRPVEVYEKIGVDERTIYDVRDSLRRHLAERLEVVVA